MTESSPLTPSGSQSLQPPKEVSFSCSMCGECCSSWNIPIETAKVEALLEKEWVKSHLKSLNTTFQKIPEALSTDLESYKIPLRGDNYCIFLAEDKRCLIETHEGKALKPEQCKRFPFAAVKLPTQEILYETSAACKSIAEKHIQQFSSILPASTFEPLDLKDVETLPEKIQVSWRKSISRETYFKILEDIQPLFALENISPEEALKAAQARFKRPKASGFKRPNKSFHFSKSWERIIPVLFLRKLYGTHSAMALLLYGVYSDPKVFGFSFSLKGQSSLQWEDQELNPRLKAFLFQILQRKIGFTRGHRLNGVLLEACITYFIVRWYTKTLAFLQEKQVCQLEDLTLAIRLTERYYTGHQPKFLEFFKKFPSVEILLVSLFGI